MSVVNASDFNLDLDQSGVSVSLLKEDPATYGRSESASELATQLKKRTFALAVSIVNLMDATSDSPAIKVIRYQLLKSATSVGANYRAVCRARSDKEFYAKLCIVVEEADETVYWLALLLKSNMKVDKVNVKTLLDEAIQLSNFFSKSRATMKVRLKKGNEFQRTPKLKSSKPFIVDPFLSLKPSLVQ